MMTIKEALTAFVTNQPSISVWIGGTGVSPATPPRFYPTTVRQDNLITPAMSYHIVGGHSEIDIGGNRNRTGYARIQISAWSIDRQECEQMVEALRLLLAGYNGPMGDNNVQVVAFEYAPDIFDHISKLSHSSCQITCYFKEA